MLRAAQRLPYIALGVLFAAMVALLTIELLLRNIVGSSIDWYDEVSRLLFVWCVFLGAAVGIRDRTHYSVTLFTHSVSEPARRRLEIIADVIVVVIALVLLKQSLSLMLIERHQLLSVTRLSAGWVDASVAVSSALMVMYAIANIVDLRVRR